MERSEGAQEQATMATKPDKTRHELSVEQQNAIDLLTTGQTDQAVAEAVGVTRQTVCGWRNHDPAFAAALNARRLEV
jgi:DNA-binding NarL/FixJ family response regulator